MHHIEQSQKREMIKMTEVGDKVLLQMGVTAFSEAPKGLQRWDGCQFVVSKRKLVDGRYLYYELQACKSAEGVPYAILEDWIVPIW